MQFITELEPGKRLVTDGEYVWVEVEGVVGEKRKMPEAITPVVKVETVTSTLASIKYQDGTSVPVSVIWDDVMLWRFVYNEAEDVIETACGRANLFESHDLENMSLACKRRLAELFTKHPEPGFDWLAASRILIDEGLLEEF